MTVYVDELRRWGPTTIPCFRAGSAHLTADSEEELHDLAARIGLRRAWFLVRHGHYSTKTGAGLREGCGAGTFRGQPLRAPLATVCATNDKHLVVPIITKHYGGVIGHEVDRTLGTVTAKDHHALTAAFITQYYGTAVGSSCADPLPTVTAGGGRGGGHLAEVRTLLERAGKATNQVSLLEDGPAGTLTIAGQRYVIADIGMRMLQPHELFSAQGFPADYVIDFARPDGRPATKTDQTALAGNSVPPQLSQALAAANVLGAGAEVLSRGEDEPPDGEGFRSAGAPAQPIAGGPDPVTRSVSRLRSAARRMAEAIVRGAPHRDHRAMELVGEAAEAEAQPASDGEMAQR